MRSGRRLRELRPVKARLCRQRILENSGDNRPRGGPLLRKRRTVKLWRLKTDKTECTRANSRRVVSGCGRRYRGGYPHTTTRVARVELNISTTFAKRTPSKNYKSPIERFRARFSPYMHTSWARNVRYALSGESSVSYPHDQKRPERRS